MARAFLSGMSLDSYDWPENRIPPFKQSIGLFLRYRLAKNADVLIHECTSASPGHSSASQAGEVATQAGAKSLLLIHYHARGIDPEYLTVEARKTFGGDVRLAQDFMEIEF